MERTSCWCGEQQLQEFSEDYALCASCGTLVLKNWPDIQDAAVDDKGELYSKDYYLKRLPELYGYPDLPSRARADLSERVLHWLEALLRYSLPPGDVLELGSAHGGFVAVLTEAGYHAVGLELSPWLVEWSQKLFQIPVLQGPLEKLDLPEASFDAVVLMDVLEHLPDPKGTLMRAASLLRPGGIFLIQTPDFKESYTYDALLQEKHPFLQQFKTDQHLFLFSERSVRHLFAQIGFTWVQFEPAIFSHYDMFFVAGRQPVKAHDDAQISAALETHRAGRIVEALLDLWQQYRESETNRMELAAALNKAHQQTAHWEGIARYRAQQAQNLLDALRQNRLFRLIRATGRWEGIESLLEELTSVELKN